MYLGTGSSSMLLPLKALISKDDDWDSIGRAFWVIRDILGRVVTAIGDWIIDKVPSLTWTTEMFSVLYSFVKAHPHPFHIISWSIFFGPIIILLPSLLLLELAILFFLNLTFFCHGLLSGSVEDRLFALKEYFADTRESLFSTVESWTNTFNVWTSTYSALLILRLFSAASGLFILIGIWTDWKFGTSVA